MADDLKIRALAALMVEKHGPGATGVIFAKAKDCSAVGDTEGARTWSKVAEVVTKLIQTLAAAASPAEPTLHHALEGSMTKAVMDGDGGERRELESVISDTKEKLDDE